MRCLTCLTVFAAFVLSARGQSVTATIATGPSPISVGVNPVANKIYIANGFDGTVTIIDGATNAAATITTGSGPQSVAVNPLTNKTYVANLNSNTVTVIDGATAGTTNVTTGASPKFVALNPVTNKIYVANSAANTVTVIDGVSLATATVAVGTSPSAIAVNPYSNVIYVTNSGSNNVTVINGANLSTTSVAVGSYPVSAAIDVITGVVYVANFNSNNVTAINGTSTSTFTTGAGPVWVALNSALNKIYVANYLGNSVTAIDGMTHAINTISVGTNPVALTMDESTDTVYTANSGSNNITVINDATGATSTLPAGTSPISIAVNPVTDKLYAANYGSANVTLVDGSTYNSVTVPVGAEPFAIAVNSVTGNTYVANYQAGTVTVINQMSVATATIPVGTSPAFIVVNPITNKIYVSCNGGVYVIDGGSNSVTSVPNVNGTGYMAINPVTNKIYIVGGTYIAVMDGATNTVINLYPPQSSPTYPLLLYMVAVNPATNKIYVVARDGSVSILLVLDGASNSFTAIANADPYAPAAIVVNSTTNKIYVSDAGTGQLLVVDGATNNFTAINLGQSSYAMDINPVTNKIYVVTSQTAPNLTVVDGVTNSVSVIGPLKSNGSNLVVNPVTNKIYFTDQPSSGTSTLAVLDGVTNTIHSIGTGVSFRTLAINQFTNQVYAADSSGNDVLAVMESQPAFVNVGTFTNAIPNNETASSTPNFGISSSLGLHFGGNYLLPDQAVFQLDTIAGNWASATGNFSSGFSATTSPLQPGLHVIYTFGGNGEHATSVQSGSPIVGAVNAYEFLVTPPALQPQTITLGVIPSQAGAFTAITITATASTPVTLSIEGPGSACTVSGLSISFGPSSNTTCTILATAAQTSVYQAAYAEFSITVVPGQYIYFFPIPAQKVGTTAALSTYDSASLPVTYTSITPYTCTVSGSTATLLNAGSCSITASQPGNGTYTAATPVTQTLTVTTVNGLGFIPVSPCRLVDTRGSASALGGPSMSAASTRSFPLPMGSCGLPTNAAAYSLNVTAVPNATLGYLSLWPTGQAQPLVSTLNSYDGRIVSNAAIVPAGTNGAVSAYVSDQSDVVIDVNGYFSDAAASGALSFVPVTPCRVEDTRNANGTFGGPILQAGSSRSWPIPGSTCSIPSTAAAYSLNETVVPSGALQYLTLYPTGSAVPYVSTLNSYNGQVVANAAIVSAGTGGAISAYVTDQTNLITDINGYFISTPATSVVFNAVTPCRLVDTRGRPILAAGSTTSYEPEYAAACGIPSTATAYALNVTVLPAGGLQYLTIWPSGQTQPTVSTLNSYNGQVVANAAIVPAGTSGSISVYVTDPTNLILDIVGYFAPPL